MTGKTAWNKGLKKETDNRLQQHSLKIIEGHKTGRLTITGCYNWTTAERSENAKFYKTGGYREKAGRSKKFITVDSFGDRVCLQSSYEMKCACVLNALSIRWTRPKALKYDGKRYFADFYLPDYQIFLDPKNDYKAKVDEQKIRSVIEQTGVLLFVLLEHQITKDYIANLVQR